MRQANYLTVDQCESEQSTIETCQANALSIWKLKRHRSNGGWQEERGKIAIRTFVTPDDCQCGPNNKQCLVETTRKHEAPEERTEDRNTWNQWMAEIEFVTMNTHWIRVMGMRDPAWEASPKQSTHLANLTHWNSKQINRPNYVARHISQKHTCNLRCLCNYNEECNNTSEPKISGKMNPKNNMYPWVVSSLKMQCPNAKKQNTSTGQIG